MLARVTGWLAGQTAVVTGSGGAMGAAIALRLASEGANIVLNDRVAEPGDIAEAVAFLVSPGARNISGQLITVAGGWNPSL
jgi:NAD(P)-dependent dehydrogenase (short-subunit alcohol dehydrogenase family)